jgi:peptide/nickel transport system substrate-binding protein
MDRRAFRWRCACSVATVTGLVAGALLAGCQGWPRRKPLAVTLDRVPVTVDPHHHNEAVSWSLLSNFYDSLVAFSPEMKIEPALAESWKQVDPVHMRFALRPGVLFHGGGRLTAADVVASFNRAVRDPRSQMRHRLVGIRQVVAEGDSAVVFETEAPTPTLVNRLAFLFIVPEGQARLPEITTPVGTGPYRFVRREPNGSVVAEAWPGWRGVPEIRRAVFSFVEDEEGRCERFLGGGVDVAARMADSMLAEVGRHPDLRLKPQPSLAVQLLVVAPHAASGVVRRALADPRVRHAMLLAIDRNDLVSRALRGHGAVASQYVHPVIFGYEPAINPLPFDPERGRALLAEAGFPDGFSVDFVHGALAPEYVDVIVGGLSRIGIRVKPIRLTLAEMLRRARAGELPLFTYGRGCGTGDASEFFDSTLHAADAGRGFGDENFSGYSDSETDTLVEAANSQLDADARLALLRRAERRVLEALPVLPLTVRSDFLGVSPRVDVQVRFDGRIWLAGFRWHR